MSTAISLTQQQLENQIFSVSGKQVMLDFHLAARYAVETKRLNEQVKRNLNRFPISFRFQSNEADWESLQSQLATTAASQDLRSQNATAKNDLDVNHLGASLKDLGGKWFAFSKLEAKSVDGMLNSIFELL
ncbi:MAG: ORF6N domain-containing protein [Algoriphagus sp.]|nr:ORF6N domain-containing protein [Algoriphagus sp.]